MGVACKYKYRSIAYPNNGRGGTNQFSVLVAKMTSAWRRLLLSISVVPSRGWSILGAASQPSTAGAFTFGSLPNSSTTVCFHRVLAPSPYCQHTATLVADGVSWTTPLPVGQYVLKAEPSGEVAASPVYLHASDYTLTSVGHSMPTRFSTAGRQAIELLGAGLYASSHAIVHFVSLDGTQTVQVDGVVGSLASGVGSVTAMTPAWPVPTDWYSGCASVDAPVRSATCVPDLPVNLSLSLDGGTTYSNALPSAFGYVPALRLAFVFTGKESRSGSHR